MGLIYLICLMGLELMELCERRDDAGVCTMDKNYPIKGRVIKFRPVFYESNPAELLENLADDDPIA